MEPMKTSTGAERVAHATEIRFGERIELRIPVKLEAGGLAGGGTLRDISLSGGLIESTLDLPIFTNLVVTLPARGETAPARSLAACVVRHAPTGLGVEWRDMACPTLMALLREAGCETTNVAPCDRAFR